jgi:hypothetical protein
MKKYILIFVSVLLVVIIVFFFGKAFSPGIYPYAEEYELNIDEQTLISLIQNFKDNNPQYKVPETMGLIDGKKKSNDHWYRIYFYYPDEHQILYTWTRPAGKMKTTFAFVRINNGTFLRNWKDINNDFSDSENAEQKKKFENRILNVIKEKI